MRRLVFALLTAAALMSATAASAASWHRFSSRSFGFSLQYPTGWTLTRTDVPRLVSLLHTGKQTYSLQVAVPPVKPGSTIGQTLSRVKAFERGRGNIVLVQAHWTATSLAGNPAMVTVIRPSTEGGVAISEGIYVVASRRHSYEITLTAYGARTISAFPSIYRQILRTWRFL